MDEAIIGYVGAVFLPGRAHGKDVAFFQLGDVMVHPEFRGVFNYLSLAPRVMWQAIREDHPSALLYGFSGRRLARWYERAGLSTILEDADDRLVPLESVAAGDSAAPVIRPWDWNNADIDAIWNRLRDTIDVGLVRDRQYLTWRYANHPCYEYRLYGVYEQAQPVGWFVTEKHVGDSSEFADEVRVQDLLIPEKLRIPALQAACTVVHAKRLVLWLPAHLCPKSLESRPTGWVVLHHYSDSKSLSREMRGSLYYTLGEVDEWWW